MIILCIKQYLLCFSPEKETINKVAGYVVFFKNEHIMIYSFNQTHNERLKT